MRSAQCVADEARRSDEPLKTADERAALNAVLTALMAVVLILSINECDDVAVAADAITIIRAREVGRSITIPEDVIGSGLATATYIAVVVKHFNRHFDNVAGTPSRGLSRGLDWSDRHGGN